MYNICCQYFNRCTYACNSPERPKFLGIFKRECVCIENLFAKCEFKLEYPDDKPPIPTLPPKKEAVLRLKCQ